MKKKIIDRTRENLDNYINEIQRLYPGFPTNVQIIDLENDDKKEEAIMLFPKIILLLTYKTADLGWCIERKPKMKNNKILLSKIERKITEYNFISDEIVLEIDKYANDIITDKAIKDIISETKLYSSDKAKIDKAYHFFCQNDFYTCSFYLATLIDSQNIKTELKHFLEEGGDIPSQCWKSYIRIVEYHFAKILFDNERIRTDKLVNGKTRREEFEKLINKINYKNFIGNEDLFINIFAIGYSLLNFFENTDWSKYHNERPAYFNRNWLTHGMYNIDDIERIDCVKLFFLLYSINGLFWKYQ